MTWGIPGKRVLIASVILFILSIAMYVELRDDVRLWVRIWSFLAIFVCGFNVCSTFWYRKRMW